MRVARYKRDSRRGSYIRERERGKEPSVKKSRRLLQVLVDSWYSCLQGLRARCAMGALRSPSACYTSAFDTRSNQVACGPSQYGNRRCSPCSISATVPSCANMCPRVKRAGAPCRATRASNRPQPVCHHRRASGFRSHLHPLWPVTHTPMRTSGPTPGAHTAPHIAAYTSRQRTPGEHPTLPRGAPRPPSGASLAIAPSRTTRPFCQAHSPYAECLRSTQQPLLGCTVLPHHACPQTQPPTSCAAYSATTIAIANLSPVTRGKAWMSVARLHS